nr:hypothetical protein BaRGS_031832 [Batillaria attramentaria]
MSCRIAHAGQLSESFEVKTGVRQGCLLSPFLFLLVIDWIMKTTTTGRKNGIQWTLWTQLDDLDFADDLALLSHSHSQMQDKTTCLEVTSAGTGLKINRRKTELMKINTTANTPVTVGGEPIREVESFVYLGSVVDGQGGTDRDVTARIGKARAAMVMLKKIWASKVVSIRTKLRIFNSNVKSVLLYGCETWRTTKTMQQKIQTFLNTCLRRIFNIRWPEKIRNEELWERAGQEPAAKQRKWDPRLATFVVLLSYLVQRGVVADTPENHVDGIFPVQPHGIPAAVTGQTSSGELEYITTKVLLQGEELLISNCYSPPTASLDLHTIQPASYNHLIVGDFNGHSPSWGYDNSDYRGEEIEDWLIDNQLILINQPDDKPAYYSRAWKKTSTPDLAMATEDLQKQTTRVVSDQLGGSDHLPIILHIADKKASTDHHRKHASWDFKRADWLKYQHHAEDLCNVTFTEDMNTNVKRLTESILTAAKRSIPRGFRKDYKPYWSKRLATLHQQLSEARTCMEQNPSSETTARHNNLNLLTYLLRPLAPRGA